ncbi:MAG: hypothetical protein ACE5J4_02375 [Candidatus Aenigmatarchaeota archaeon]
MLLTILLIMIIWVVLYLILGLSILKFAMQAVKKIKFTWTETFLIWLLTAIISTIVYVIIFAISLILGVSLL